jgi:hypothetical protein
MACSKPAPKKSSKTAVAQAKLEKTSNKLLNLSSKGKKNGA